MFRELRATAPQTYYTFRTSNGTADVLYVLLISLTALGLQALFSKREKWKRHNGKCEGKLHFAHKNFKTTADVRYILSGASFPPQTCDKNKIGFLEVNFYEQQKS